MRQIRTSGSEGGESAIKADFPTPIVTSPRTAMWPGKIATPLLWHNELGAARNCGIPIDTCLQNIHWQCCTNYSWGGVTAGEAPSFL